MPGLRAVVFSGRPGIAGRLNKCRSELRMKQIRESMVKGSAYDQTGSLMTRGDESDSMAGCASSVSSRNQVPGFVCASGTA